MAETSNNPVEAMLGLVKSQLLDVNTALPGIIVSYDNGLARVVPTGKKRFADGDVLDYPIIPNVRVCWPSFAGGTAGVKGPVKPGDKCLLVFSQQAIDGTDDRRMFDLQDAYAIMCDLGNAGISESDNNDDMTMFFGDAYIRLTAAGGLNIYAPGGSEIDSPNTYFQGNFHHTNGTITSLGKRIDGTHTHGGIMTGGANTAVPNP